MAISLIAACSSLSAAGVHPALWDDIATWIDGVVGAEATNVGTHAGAPAPPLDTARTTP